jgi:hypothetical protein
LPIDDIRNSKLEIRNSQKALLQLSGPEFRFSSFDFLPPQSAISPPRRGNEKLVFGCDRATQRDWVLTLMARTRCR